MRAYIIWFKRRARVGLLNTLLLLLLLLLTINVYYNNMVNRVYNENEYINEFSHNIVTTRVWFEFRLEWSAQPAALAQWFSISGSI